jgi:hypothetical protein
MMNENMGIIVMDTGIEEVIHTTRINVGMGDMVKILQPREIMTVIGFERDFIKCDGMRVDSSTRKNLFSMFNG